MDLAAARFERERLAHLRWAWNGSTSRNICGVSVACTAYAATGTRWIATRNLDRFILPRRRDARWLWQGTPVRPEPFRNGLPKMIATIGMAVCGLLALGTA